MKLATSTNLICDRPHGTIMPIEEMLEIASQAGFTRFDMNFYDWALPHSPFLTDEWEPWINRIAEKAADLGVTFGQSHAYTFNFLDQRLTTSDYNYHQSLVERSIYCCTLLGSKTIVTHPDTDYSTLDIVKNSKTKNTEYFTKLLDFSTRYDVTLAVENMWDYSVAPTRKYFVTPEEIIDFIDSFNDPRLGVCWDFEHGDIMKMNQREVVMALNKRLKATHVSDTHSYTDTDLMHVLPLFGNIDWPSIMSALKHINYQGDFSFEAHNYANKLPDEVLQTAIKLSFEIGNYLLSLT